MTPLVAYLLLFVAVGAGFIFVHLMAGKMIRPDRPGAEKQTIYECGEPTIGSAWIQFDLRFYVVALLFVIFDVEVAFFFPWAEVFGKSNAIVAENNMPADFGSMKAYSARMLELTPQGSDTQLTALFHILASMSSQDFVRLQSIAAAVPKAKTDADELAAAQKSSRTALDSLAISPAKAGERLAHRAILALTDPQQWQDLRLKGPTFLFPEAVDANTDELLRVLTTMKSAEYQDFLALARSPGDLRELKQSSREVLHEMLRDSEGFTTPPRAHLALLAMNSDLQLEALRSSGVPLTPMHFDLNQSYAHSLSWLALGEIAVFFGVLLVGFAYLWKRGDLAWVRSLQAERQAATQLSVPFSESAPAEPALAEAAAHH